MKNGEIIRHYFEFPIKQRLQLYKYFLKHVKPVWHNAYKVSETYFVFNSKMTQILGYGHQL